MLHHVGVKWFITHKCVMISNLIGLKVPGGGGTQVKTGAAPALRISPKKVSFLRPPHVRLFVKEGYFFVPRYEVWGVKIPLQSTKYTRL